MCDGDGDSLANAATDDAENCWKVGLTPDPHSPDLGTGFEPSASKVIRTRFARQISLAADVTERHDGEVIGEGIFHCLSEENETGE